MNVPDFDEIWDRRREHSLKYEGMAQRFGAEAKYPLWVADMDFPVAEAIQRAIEERAAMRIFGYPLPPASYHDSLIAWYKRRYGYAIRRDSILHSPGVVTSLGAVIQTLTKPGDGVIIQSPVYPPFASMTEGNGRVVLRNPLVEKDGCYTMDYEGLDRLAGEASLLILCNPHNPVGRVWSRGELERLAALCEARGLRVLADEIHGDLSLGGKRYTPFASVSPAAERLAISCLSASKTFNMAGLQSSFIVAPREEDFKKVGALLASLEISVPNNFAIVATQAAYESGEPWLEAMLAYVEGNADFVIGFFEQRIPRLKARKPQGSYLLWVDCRGLGLSDEALNAFMRGKARIACNPGSSFGAEGAGYVRLNLATSRRLLEAALVDLEQAVQKLD